MSVAWATPRVDTSSITPLTHQGTSSSSAPSAAQFYAPLAGRHGSDLVAGVQALLTQSHRGAGYDAARDFMYANLDRSGPSQPMIDLYTGAALVGVRSRETANASRVNAEHLWPQSQGATGELKSDLHHLAATAQKINEYRWHLPFGAVRDAQDGAAPFRIPKGAGSVGFDAAGRLVYEPRDGAKGRIARSLMYAQAHFGAAHGLPSRLDARDFTDSLPTLLSWHQQFKATPDEMLHNDMVAERQGTRNPLIDHPEWASELMAGLTTVPAPRPRAAQLNDWVSFLRDPSGRSRGQRH